MRTLFLVAVLTLTACDSQPQPKTIDEINQIIRIADKSIGVVQKIGAGASTADVQGAMRELYATLDAARSQVDEITLRVTVGEYLGRGSIDPINVSACISAHAASVHYLEHESTRPTWVMNVGECAIKASTYFGAVSSDDGAAVALAIGIIYPIALVANVKAGLTAGPWLQQYRSVNETIVTRLAPQCRERKAPNSAGSEQVRYKCAAYEVAMSVRPKLEALADRVATSP
jgi:hypothetical protein